jgi:hypothetical protein
MKYRPFRPSLITRGIATRMGRNAACSGLTKRRARCGHAARAQICLTATSSPPSTRNNSDPSQTSPHFYHLLPHPSRTFVLRPAKHLRRPKAGSGCCAALLLCRSGRTAMQPAAKALLLSARRPRCPWPETKEETMRVLSQGVVAMHENGAYRPAAPDHGRTAASGRRLK